ncbi:MAG TPA: hypothetical protein VIX42_07330 [Edaphobacter sp.]
MVSRSAVFVLFLSCIPVFAQTAAPADPHRPKIFRDAALAITYSYPGEFMAEKAAVPPKADSATPRCVQSTLSGGSTTKLGSSVFVLSTMDNACPGVLLNASKQLGPFTKEQILRQLKSYGTPVVTQEPVRYSIDGHPAAITMGSAQPDETQPGKTPVTTYAAKACVLGNVAVKATKTEPAQSTKHILCLDFTTQQKDLLPLMLGFTIQFDEGKPQSMVPGNILR